jgi:hypothetical protein
MNKVKYLKEGYEKRWKNQGKFGKLLWSIISNLNDDYSIKIVERIIRHDGKVVNLDLHPLEIWKTIKRNYLEERLTISIYDENKKIFRNVILEEIQ